MSTWFITGCSTGLGRSLAEAVLAHGDDVVVTARKVETLDEIVAAHPDHALALPLDVTDAGQIAAAVAGALERFGRIDVLVNNAGYGYRAAIEEGDDHDVRALFDTHFFGTIDVTKAVLPHLRAQRSGTIVNISSIGATLSPEGSGYYSAAKAAIEGATASLRKEVAPLGITAFAVEPGGFRTDFAGRSLTQSAEAIPDYAETAGKRRIEAGTGHGTQPGDPAKAGEAIIRAVESGDAPGVLLLGEDALTGYRAALTARLADADTWEATSLSTAFSG